MFIYSKIVSIIWLNVFTGFVRYRIKDFNKIHAHNCVLIHWIYFSYFFIILSFHNFFFCDAHHGIFFHLNYYWWWFYEVECCFCFNSISLLRIYLCIIQLRCFYCCWVCFSYKYDYLKTQDSIAAVIAKRVVLFTK